MSIEIRLRGKYLHHQVKKVSPPKGGSSGTSKSKRFRPPGKVGAPSPARGTRMLVLDQGRRAHWVWV